ncbi:hypothetical protein [Pseudomonas sp.]|uniref:hypothetical protein n=1 Tax=Pseudomonas sp. TaxID=306 RepID=UPI003FD6E178
MKVTLASIGIVTYLGAEPGLTKVEVRFDAYPAVDDIRATARFEVQVDIANFERATITEITESALAKLREQLLPTAEL